MMACVSQRKLLPPLDRHISHFRSPIDLAPALVAVFDASLLERSQPHSDTAWTRQDASLIDGSRGAFRDHGRWYRRIIRTLSRV